MGMDLKPVAPTPEAPRHPLDDKFSPGEPVWGRYNWVGWGWLTDKLLDWGLDLSEFRGVNDGDVISEATCLKVAEAIEAHKKELDGTPDSWLLEDAVLWRTCGGYEQW